MQNGPFHFFTVQPKGLSILAFVLGVRVYGGITNHLMIKHLSLPFLLVFFTYPISAYAPYAADMFNGCSCQAGCHEVLFLC
jgi:hypothetical protein